MKKSILFNYFIFCLLGFSFNNYWLAQDGLASTLVLSEMMSNTEAELTTLPPVCNTPTWPTTSNVTETSATFSWDAVSGAMNYTVQTRLPGGTWGDVPGGPFTMTLVTVYGLNPGTTYEWRVRANCSGGEYSPWTASIIFTTDGSSSCQPPSWLETTNIGQTTATWDWSPVSGAVNYSIQWRYPGGTWYNLSGGPFTNTHVNVGGLQPGTSYEWRVRSNCAYGVHSAWSAAEGFTTDGSSCDPPSWLGATNITSTSATLDWSAATGAMSYTVEWRVAGGTWYTLSGGPFTSTWADIWGLQPGTTYEWKVKSNCQYGVMSGWSNSDFFTTSGSSCFPPSWLGTINITSTTATWDWSAAPGAISYSIQWRYPGGTWYNLSGGPFTNTWVNVGNLQPGTTYEWRVRSNCANGVYSDWSYSVTFTTDGSSCNPPSWLGTINITQTSATLDWSSASGAISYTVEWRVAGGTWYTLSGSPFTNTWAEIWGLQPGTTYEWRVKSNCSSGVMSSWSYIVIFTTDGASCEAPSWLGTINITQTSATLDWTAASGAISYTVEWRVSGGTWYILSGSPFTNTWANISGLQPGTTYEWRVRSNCAYGMTSGWSYIASFTTNGVSCEIPGIIGTLDITQTSATLDWASATGAISYSVQWRIAGGPWNDLSGGPFTNTIAYLSGLQPGTTYEWRVRSNCSFGLTSDWSPIAAFTTNAPTCDAPSLLSTINITQTSATFDWSPVAGANSYAVMWRVSGGPWMDLVGSPFTDTHANITGLQPGTTYEWQVRTNCSNGLTSEWSPIAAFTTSDPTCDPPVGLTTYNITDSTATLDWVDVVGATGYGVMYRVAGGPWIDLPGGPFTVSQANISGLLPSTTYEWQVRAFCFVGMTSNWSVIASFTTTGPSCDPPSWHGAIMITQTTAILDWLEVTGAISYSVQWRTQGGPWNDLAGGPFTDTHASITGLTPGTTYEWRVRSNCANGQVSEWSVIAIFTTQGGTSPCNPPNWLATVYITSTSASLDWSAVNGAISYSVQWRVAGGFWYDLSGSPFTTTWASLTGLQPGTTYEWRVKSNCPNGQMSEWSYIVTFTTLPISECEPPNWLETLNIGQTTATWDWSPVNGAISYSIQWRYPGGTWYNLSGGPWTNTHVHVGGLQPGTTYEWRVRSNCAYGYHSDWSVPEVFTTDGSSCNPPSWLGTFNITSSSATLDWSSVYGAWSYTVEWRIAGGTWYTLSGGPFTSTWATITGLQPGTTYQWRVKTNCSYGEMSEWSYIVSFTTLGSTCNPPSWLGTTYITQTSATLDWNAASGAISYSVQWRVAGSGTWYDLASGPFMNTWANISGLQPGTTYEWRVRSNCSYNSHSEWSYIISFTTSGGATCEAPSWLGTGNITQTSATLDWSSVSGAISYSVQWRIAGGTWYDLSGGPFTATWANITGLQPGTTYEWRVRSNCSNGMTSPWSAIQSFTTDSSSGSGNDYCQDATWLTVGNTCNNTASSNVGATPSIPAPVGGCPANFYKDVWFRFTIPNTSNPFVTIRTTAGSMTDAVMEVYVGSSCSNLTYLTCENDNNNGNGSDMPVVNLMGGPNSTIWVRVWGYNGMTGTFSICVFDYFSANLTDNSDVVEIPYSGEQLEPVQFDAEEIPAQDNVKDLPVLQIRPNPASDNVNITFEQTEDTKVTAIALIELSGKNVFMKSYEKQDINEFSEELDVGNLTPGIYILQMMTTKGIISEKLVVAR